MKTIIKHRLLLMTLAVLLSVSDAGAISLWVGQSYTWDFGGSVMGSTYNMSVSSNGGYLSITGSGFYRNITPTQYFSGTATVTAEWDYTLYYGDTRKHQRVTLSITCNENKVSISPTSVTLTPGQTYQLSYRHAYDNAYVGAANAYFSGGNSSFSVSSSGLITAKAPGTGYVNVYSKVSNAANAPSCFVTVKEVEPTGATISNTTILADESKNVTVTVSPSNATVRSEQWYVKHGSDVVSFSGSRLYGLKPGEATVYCMVNGSVRSNDATVTVTEPKLVLKSTLPEDNASEVSVFTNPAATYSHALLKGDSFSSVKLAGGGKSVDGNVEISSNVLRFIPRKPLSPKTKYELTIPRTAVKNKWGSPAQTDVKLSFTTGSLEKATVTVSPAAGSYLTRGDAVTLSSYPADAIIYYTVDGSEPTRSSAVYTAPITSDKDFTVKALACREGYEDSEVATAEFLKSQSEIVDYYPADAKPLFNYGFAVPHIKLSGAIVKSNNFRRISLTDDYGNDVAGTPLLTNYIVAFVPDEPLENGRKYTMDIPRDAVKTTNGEVFKGFSWIFTTPVMNTVVRMRGDETVYVLAENGKLCARGLRYKSYNAADGSYVSDDNKELKEVMSDIREIETGYTHEMERKESEALGYGFAFCGETGTQAGRDAVGSPKAVRAGFQTSAIIADDSSLWMCGRNDFYQLGDGTGTTARDFVKVAENIKDVALGNSYSLWVDGDNVLWAVGRNHRGQLGDGTKTDRMAPVKVMDGTDRVFASASGFFSACITVDGRLLTWGDNASGQLGREAGAYSAAPGEVLGNVSSVALGDAHSLALTEDYKLFAWGSNAFSQISTAGGKVAKPTLLAENVKDVDAGPNSTLILFNSGRVAAYGRKTHANFGDGDGNAVDFTVDAALPYALLQDVSIEPARYEAEPETEFALIALPKPYTADFATVEWSSDNPQVADVEGNGVIRTSRNGKAVITVRLTDRFGNVKDAKATVVCTDNPDNSGVDNVVVNSSEWTVRTEGLTIRIEGIAIDNTISIFNSQGTCVFCAQSDTPSMSFDAVFPGVYIVSDGRKTVKVICR